MLFSVSPQPWVVGSLQQTVKNVGRPKRFWCVDYKILCCGPVKPVGMWLNHTLETMYLSDLVLLFWLLSTCQTLEGAPTFIRKPLKYFVLPCIWAVLFHYWVSCFQLKIHIKKKIKSQVLVWYTFTFKPILFSMFCIISCKNVSIDFNFSPCSFYIWVSVCLLFNTALLFHW